VAVEYVFSDSRAAIDRARVHSWLSEQAYWASGRTREVQDAAIDASRNYGVFQRDSGEQVAYARVVTDAATFAWLCDVFVSPHVRGTGVGKQLIAGVVADLEPLRLKRILLATGDAHGLYAQYGFTALDDPTTMMARTADATSTPATPALG
jgi:N-acetylglutamate synthase-like GNAT family acetyltransferase